MGDRRVSVEHLRDLLCVWHFIIVFIIYLILDPCMFRDIGHALAICSVGADQELVVRPRNASQDRLNAECAAALHEHCRIFFRRHMGQLKEPFPDLLCDLFIVVIPCTVVKKHLLFYRVRSCQRSRCQ